MNGRFFLMKKTNFSKVIKSVMSSIAALVAVAATVTSVSAASSFDELVKNALESKTSTVDISSLAIAPETAVDNFHNFLQSNPEFYYVDSDVQCTFSGNTAKTLKISYEADDNRNTVNEIVNSIVQQASQYSTDYDKAKFVHDYLVENSSYDYSLTKFSTYDLLVNKTGVCQAYAYSYKLILNKLGIECEYAKSTSMEHMWNVVKIDGVWYNVDCTWSNTTRIPGDKVSNAYFLKSNDYFTAVGYFDWITTNNVSCTSTTYDFEM
jgi:transglutaminase/protease-like cytokinesis protein 3